MRVRGTAQQLYEKYQQLARDASGNGDRVLGEAYYQHAEHYFRIVSAINQAQGTPNPAPNGQANGESRGNYEPRQNGQGDYQRRDTMELTDAPAEQRQPEPRQQETRPQQEPRQQEPRQQEPRRFEQRQYEPRQKPEYQRPERTYRPEPVVDSRIDISSALEAELAAAAQAAAVQVAAATAPGLGEQPVIEAPPPRAIAIIPDAPPPVEAAAPRVSKPRGRPRAVKVVEEGK
jgi:hypothetical protein